VKNFLKKYAQRAATVTLGRKHEQNRTKTCFNPMNKHITHQYILLLFGLAYANFAQTQIIYTSTTTNPNGSNQLLRVDLAACTTSVATNATVFNDMAVGLGITFYTAYGNTIYSVNSVTGVSTFIATVPGLLTGLEYGPNGLIYALGQNLFSINPANGAVVNIGPLPAGWLCVGDLVYLNGNYYATMQLFPGPDFLAQINMTNPALSTIISSTLPGEFMVAGAGVTNANCPKMYWLDLVGGNSVIWEFDLNTQTWVQKCPGLVLAAGGAGTFPGYSFPFTCATCITNAGSLQPAALQICGTAAVTVPYNNNAVLESGDLLQYVLVSNQNNPAGSIVATSNTATIPYTSSLLIGQTYYVATVAGNNVGGNVDLTDPCLDFSNLVPVTWRPLPTVSFTVPTPNVCAGDCFLATSTMTGTPPYALSGTVTYPNGTTGNFSQNFTTNTGATAICVPIGSSNGQIALQATLVSDAFCTCQ
jgi:hypothetical protein